MIAPTPRRARFRIVAAAAVRAGLPLLTKEPPANDAANADALPGIASTRPSPVASLSQGTKGSSLGAGLPRPARDTSFSSDPEAGVTTTALPPERERSCSHPGDPSASTRLESDCRSVAKRNLSTDGLLEVVDFVRSGSETGVDAGGCSATRAVARCACRSGPGRLLARRRLPQPRQSSAVGRSGQSVRRSTMPRNPRLATSRCVATCRLRRAFVFARASNSGTASWLSVSASSRRSSLCRRRDRGGPMQERNCAGTVDAASRGGRPRGWSLFDA